MIPMNLFIDQKQTHTYSKQMHGYHRGKRGGRDKLEFEMSRFRLLYFNR